MSKLSVVIPAHNEEPMIAKMTDAVTAVLRDAPVNYEIIFVDDGSRDRTWECIVHASGDPHVRGISFSRNFGKESAILAGLAEATGDCVAVMDCDMQHPPEKLIEMMNLWLQGYEVIEGVKISRGQETAVHGFFARLFYRIMSGITSVDMQNSSDFKLLDRKAVDALLHMPEKNTFFRALSSWIGFRTGKVEYTVQERAAGKTQWSRSSLVRYALSVITSFTSLPMQIVSVLGVLMFLIGMAASVEALVSWVRRSTVEGYTTIVILECFSASIIMLSLGVIGYYVARIYDELKGRPRYIISERTGKAADADS